MCLFNFGTRRIPKESSEDRHGVIYVLCGLSVVFYVLLRFFPIPEIEITRTQMLHASQMMAEALEIVQQCRRNNDLSIDEEADPNRTGLIGQEFSRQGARYGFSNEAMVSRIVTSIPLMSPSRLLPLPQSVTQFPLSDKAGSCPFAFYLV